MTRNLILLPFCLLVGTLLSCVTTNAQPRSMIGPKFTFERVEVVDSEIEVVVTDADALSAIRTILQQSTEVADSIETIEFAEKKKLRLIAANARESRIYLVDLKNGYATILSKQVMPVYHLRDLDRFNEILQASGKPTPTAR